MAILWTIAANGTEKSLADWGITQVTRSLVSQGTDELTFRTNGANADDAPLFTYRSTLTLWRDRAQNRDGSFSGGTPWFTGLVIQVPRAGAATNEVLGYKIAGPWWYLDNLVFQQPYQKIFLGYAFPNDPTSAIYGPGNSSHLFLNQSTATDTVGKITTGDQIVEALNWVIKPFLAANVMPPLQIGSVTPDVDVPIDEVRDITCAEVIHKMLRWTPDAVTWFDYGTTPPTFHCQRRGELAVASIDISKT